MLREELAVEAAACREQAEHFQSTERKILLKMARTFDRLAARAGDREVVESARCW